MTTKSNEIIKTIEDLARHYGKLLATYWLPWIPTIGLVLFMGSFIKYLIDSWGEVSTPTPVGWSHLLITGFVGLFWLAGFMVGEIPHKKKEKQIEKQ